MLNEQIPQDFISSLDTAITKETNIENLHAKIKYLNNQLNKTKFELRKHREKFDLINDKFDEIIHEYRTEDRISSSHIRSFYEILGVNE